MTYSNVQINDAKFVKFTLMSVLLSRVPMVLIERFAQKLFDQLLMFYII